MAALQPDADIFNPNEHPHMRYNPLRDEWVLVSPHRLQRPWAGQMEHVAAGVGEVPSFDPTNPLCPGVLRASGMRTPEYTSTYVFTNDFPALLEDGPSPPSSPPPPPAPEEVDEADHELFQCRAARGTCRVICYHPRSDVHLPTMTLDAVVEIVDEWVRQTRELETRYEWVQIFENRGAMMGCSNAHPHGQIWASRFLPNEARLKDARLRAYYEAHARRPLLAEYVRREVARRERVVVEGDAWVALVPYWATWPFETLVVPRRAAAVRRLSDLTDAGERRDLAAVLRRLLTRYDNLFACAFPFSMGWHGAPTGSRLAADAAHWTLHAVYLPPLLRSAAVRKFAVGYELLAQSQRDLTPERAAALLREQSDVHYTQVQQAPPPPTTPSASSAS